MLIDTFLFSEPHEADLLYLKFVLEDPCVDYWIIQENEYTLKGDYKGLFASQVLSDARFQPYIHKIVLLSSRDLLFPGKRDENTNFQREKSQRQYCHQALTQIKETSQHYIIVSDTDEMIDFTDVDRSNKFIELINNWGNGPFWVGRKRFWYDYDNDSLLPNIRIPVIPLDMALSNSAHLAEVRHYNHEARTYNISNGPLAFEYSYVFKDIEGIWRKKCTFAHDRFSLESIKESLRTNTWPQPKDRNESYREFEKVELTPENSPKYVRDNLQSLRTNVVNPNYKEARLHANT